MGALTLSRSFSVRERKGSLSSLSLRLLHESRRACWTLRVATDTTKSVNVAHTSKKTWRSWFLLTPCFEVCDLLWPGSSVRLPKHRRSAKQPLGHAVTRQLTSHRNRGQNQTGGHPSRTGQKHWERTEWLDPECARHKRRCQILARSAGSTEWKERSRQLWSTAGGSGPGS